MKSGSLSPSTCEGSTPLLNLSIDKNSYKKNNKNTNYEGEEEDDARVLIFLLFEEGGIYLMLWGVSTLGGLRKSWLGVIGLYIFGVFGGVLVFLY